MGTKRKRKPKTAPPARQVSRPSPPAGAAWVWKRDGAYAGLVFLVAFGVFANSLSNGFVYDDTGIIEHNSRLDRVWDLPTFFSTSYWGELLPNSLLYRPLAVMSFAVDRAIFGRGPFGVHFMNVLANGVVAVLAYALLFRLVGRRDVALLAALLFAVHPVHTEVVANGVGRSELYAVLVMLAGMHLHLTFASRRLEGGVARRAARAVGDGRPRSGGYLAGAVALYLVALLLKESAVVLPGLVFLMDWLILRRGRLWPMQPRLGWYFVYALPLVVYLGARVAVVGTGTPAIQEVMIGASSAQRALYASETALRYVGQLVFPLWLCAEYADYTNLIRPPVADPMVLASLFAWAGCVVLVVWLARRGQYLVLFAIGWFFLTLLPASNLIVQIGTIRADRLMYLPSLGFVLVAAHLIAELGRRQRYLAVGLVVVILGFYGWRSVDRNRDWRTHESLWTVTLRQNPGSAVGWLGMGEVHREKGESEQAELAYKRSWELRGGIGYFYPEAHNLYAYMLRQRGDLAGAEQHFRQVLSRDPRQPVALMNLGELLFREASSRAEAIDLFQRAIAEAPGDFRAYVNLAQAYKLDGNFGPALEAINQAIALSPDEASPWNVKAEILRLAGRMQEAQQARQQARRLRGRG